MAQRLGALQRFDQDCPQPLCPVPPLHTPRPQPDFQKKGSDFPYNLEPVLLGRELRLPKGARRRMVTVKLVMRQLLEALRDCHATGIVHRCARGGGAALPHCRGLLLPHMVLAQPCCRTPPPQAHTQPPNHPPPYPPPPPTRDFKPQNTIVSTSCRRVKLIDFGAAADLRLGINYVPNEYLLDPRCVCGGRGGGSVAARAEDLGRRRARFEAAGAQLWGPGRRRRAATCLPPGLSPDRAVPSPLPLPPGTRPPSSTSCPARPPSPRPSPWPRCCRPCCGPWRAPTSERAAAGARRFGPCWQSLIADA